MTLIVSGQVSADDDSPFQTFNEELFLNDTVYAQEQGAFQITLQPVWHAERNGEQLSYNAGFEYGITAYWQTEIELEQEAGDDNGVEWEAGTQFNLFSSPEYALAMGLEYADSDQGSEWQPYVTVGWQLAEHWQLHLGFYHTLDSDLKSEATEVQASGLCSLNDTLYLTVEYATESADFFDSDEERENSYAIGMQWEIGEYQFGIAAGLNESAEGSEWDGHFLFTMEFE